jgi:hypothetical protein
MKLDEAQAINKFVSMREESSRPCYRNKKSTQSLDVRMTLVFTTDLRLY